MHFPGWGGHALLGRIAFETLPTWEKDAFRPDMSEEGLKKPFMSDRVKTVGDKVGYMCAILDLVYHDECRPFATLPDGRWIPHSPPDERWQSATGSGHPPCPIAAVQITELLLERTAAAIRAGDWESAVRHGGALGHYLQEPFTPGHAMDNTIFHELFPDPDPTRHIRLHHAFDAASGEFEPLPPVLMGVTIPEAAYRLQVEIRNGIREGKKVIAPVIRSAYAGEPGEVRQRLLARQSQWASYTTACAWHTVMSIAKQRFVPAEVTRLSTLKLTEIQPYFLHAWQYVEVLPGCLVRDKRKIPIHVWAGKEGNGPTRPDSLVKEGFGMGGHMGIKFFVAGDVYPRFRCRAGLPSRHSEGQTEHTNTRFFVEMDRELNRVYSEDIEYGAQTLAEILLVPGKAPTPIDVDLRGARTLILRAKSQPYQDPTTGEPRFSIPHVAVCEPVLSKE